MTAERSGVFLRAESRLAVGNRIGLASEGPS